MGSGWLGMHIVLFLFHRDLRSNVGDWFKTDWRRVEWSGVRGVSRRIRDGREVRKDEAILVFELFDYLRRAKRSDLKCEISQRTSPSGYFTFTYRPDTGIF